MATLRDEDDDAAPGKTEETVDTNETPDVEVIEAADERLSNDEGNEQDDDEGQDERPRRVKETAAERRARAKAAKERDKRELDFQRREMDRLQRKLDEVTQRQTVNAVSQIDERLSTELSTIDQMTRVKAAAISKNNGADAVAAEKLANEAQQRAWQLQQQREQLVQEANKPKVVVPQYIDKARAFMDANPWYNHEAQDGDSLIVKQIDNEVAKEYVPTSEAYWNELQRRVKKNLPHHFSNDSQGDDEVDETPVSTRRGPPTGGSSRTSTPSSGSGQIRLSPERVNAMKEAGLWDDPKTRAKMAKKYAEYDRSQRA